MSDRNIIPSAPGVGSAVRLAMRCSSSHRVDLQTPHGLSVLLDRLDEAEARHVAEVAAFRAGQR